MVAAWTARPLMDSRLAVVLLLAMKRPAKRRIRHKVVSEFR